MPSYQPFYRLQPQYPNLPQGGYFYSNSQSILAENCMKMSMPHDTTNYAVMAMSMVGGATDNLRMCQPKRLSLTSKY